MDPWKGRNRATEKKLLFLKRRMIMQTLSMHMKIRTANNTDRDNIVQLVKDGLKEFGFDYSPETSESDLLDIEREYIKNGGTFLVLENKKNELIATGALKKLSNNQYKIRKMYVSKSHRRKGYGNGPISRFTTLRHH